MGRVKPLQLCGTAVRRFQVHGFNAQILFGGNLFLTHALRIGLPKTSAPVQSVLMQKIRALSFSLVSLILIALAASGADTAVPEPKVIDPGSAACAPSDAIVLFNGTDLSQWCDPKGKPARWEVTNGFARVNGTGPIRTTQAFGDCQLHVEWASPREGKGTGQARGNSGIFLQGRYEVQVLNSYQNPTYPNGQAGAIYGINPPSVNASRKTGEWQTYDIVFHAAQIGKAGENGSSGRITVLHNGVLVQDNVELKPKPINPKWGLSESADGKLPVVLQDHHCPVRFRNIWIRELN